MSVNIVDDQVVPDVPSPSLVGCEVSEVDLLGMGQLWQELRCDKSFTAERRLSLVLRNFLWSNSNRLFRINGYADNDKLGDPKDFFDIFPSIGDFLLTALDEKDVSRLRAKDYLEKDELALEAKLQLFIDMRYGPVYVQDGQSDALRQELGELEGGWKTARDSNEAFSRRIRNIRNALAMVLIPLGIIALAAHLSKYDQTTRGVADTSSSEGTGDGSGDEVLPESPQ